MIEITEKIKALSAMFDQSGRAVFRDFLAYNSQVTRWCISADFCLHDEDRPNNVLYFSLTPYDATFVEVKGEIQKSIPKNWRKSEIIPAGIIEFLRDERRFHIAFILPRAPQVFYNGGGSDPFAVACELASMTIDALIGQRRTGDSLRRLEALKQKSKANRFDTTLLSDLYLLSDLFCFATLPLTREQPIEMTGWLPDHDKMTT